MMKEDLELLRKRAHEAPMNQVAQDHTGRRYLLTHSMSWAKASREYAEALAALRPTTQEPPRHD